PEAASLHLFRGGKHIKQRVEHEEQGEFSQSRGRLPAPATAFAAGDTGMGCLNRSGEGARRLVGAGNPLPPARERAPAPKTRDGGSWARFATGETRRKQRRSCRRPRPLLPGRLCDFVNQMNAALRLDFVQEAAE
ncbi:hypothetical protein U1Q18_032472, partial [Sarracenia purpurea var. burkii]